MEAPFKRSTAIARFAVLLVVFAVPTMTIAGTDLSISYGSPPYTIAATCDLTQPLAFISLAIANRGGDASASTLVSAFDAGGVLTGDRQTLPPIAAGKALTLRLPIRYLNGSSGQIGGDHAITITVGLQRRQPLTVAIPPGLCTTPAHVLRGDRAVAPPAAATAQRARVAAPAAGGTAFTKVEQSSATLAKIADRALTVPINVRVASGAADCALHIGQIVGSLICPDMIRSGNLLLVWEWRPGAGPDRVDGYRVYRVDGGKRLVDTRGSQDLMLTDLPVPRGGYPGTCYSVTAFAGTRESAMSPAFCPTRKQTTVGANPTVATPPPAPLHVVIHITEDSYPENTIVAAGGDVTWINDDSDDHTVYDGTNAGVIVGGGGRYTFVFRDVGRSLYTVPYNCQYHSAMVGKITVVKNP